MILSEETAKEICLTFLTDKLDIKKYHFPTTQVGAGWMFNIMPFSQNDSLIGVGGIYIRKDGSILELGSIYSQELHIEMIEKGYAEHAVWDIFIEKVHKQKQSIDFLYELNVGYLEKPVENGEERKIFTRFTSSQLEKKLQKLPLQLKLPNMYFIWQYIESEKNKNNLSFCITKNTGFENSNE